jgi:2-succinyl-6-hydroxy-2,4-cyclohexadiene-1-carboxylate synthase
VPLLEGPGVTISYTIAGAGEPVTVLHGFTLSGDSWRETISKMPAGWLWIVPDLRGHGATRMEPGAPCTMDACATDLRMLWDHLGIRRSHLVGYSMGGRLALHVAVRLPERVRSLLTLGANAGLDPDARAARRESDEGLAARIQRSGVEAFVDWWSAQPLFAGLQRRGARFTARRRAERMRNRADGLAASLRGMGAGAMEPLWAELGRVGCPSTFVAGEDDHAYVASARRMAELVPGARLEVVPGAGHAAHMERPAAFARVLAAHLRWADSANVAGSSASSTTSA